MKCLKCRRLLVEYSEKRLDNHALQDMREHLRECPSCRSELERLLSSIDIVRSVDIFSEIPEPPEDFAERVLAQISQKNVEHPSLAVKIMSGVAVVSCVLLFAIAISTYLNHTAKERRLIAYSPVGESIKVTIPNGFKMLRLSDIRSAKQNWRRLKPKTANTEVKQAKTDRASSNLDSQKTQDTIEAHIGMELARKLGQTLEIIESGEQQWEIEI